MSLERLAELLRERNRISSEIAILIGRSVLIPGDKSISDDPSMDDPLMLVQLESTMILAL
jgi:hypothetical protein